MNRFCSIDYSPTFAETKDITATPRPAWRSSPERRWCHGGGGTFTSVWLGAGAAV